MLFRSASRARRYFRTKPATPCSLSHFATAYPSWSTHNSAWPPPGAITTAAPVADSCRGNGGYIPYSDGGTDDQATFPASDPWATAVGGTSLEIGASGTPVAEYV